MGRNWNNESETLTPSNDFPKASERDDNLEQKFHTLRRRSNMNQGKSGRNPRHSGSLEYERDQSDSGTPSHGGINSIFPTTVQQLQDLKFKGKHSQDSSVIPGIFQKRTLVLK
ncbi:hypothetical protein O181_059614 [Austropuccinia psidii MF-1]|uniref:Uncharacterized protein n=1 Tax=Austropuccinia psidii MF-1 TaxID=1389203 RepID=A0A9Q3EEL8_9BASI|nr:hypothetical protein [Austropuccinia psidii MF-1]